MSILLQAGPKGPERLELKLNYPPRLGLDTLADLLRRWPRRRTSKGFLGVFSVFVGRAPTWARVPRLHDKLKMDIVAADRNNSRLL
jgi:hypothetical protein